MPPGIESVGCTCKRAIRGANSDNRQMTAQTFSDILYAPPGIDCDVKMSLGGFKRSSRTRLDSPRSMLFPVGACINQTTPLPE